MLGHIGKNELAAVGLCTSIHMVANSLVFGLAAGVGLLCAQYFGANDSAGITKTTNTGAALAWAFMLPLAVLFASVPSAVISVATNDPVLIAMGADYLRFTSVLPVMIGTVVVVGAGINALGKPQLNLLFTGIAVGLNVFFNWLLIFGNWGAPAMGVKGAALATVMSIAVELAIIFAYLNWARLPVRISLQLLRQYVSRANMVSFLRISLPLIIGGAAWHVGAFMYQVAYGHMGATQLAAITMVQPLRLLCFSFFWGISSATGVMIGHLLGASRFDEAYTRSRILIVLGMIAAIIAAAGVWVTRHQIWMLFGGLDRTTVAMAEDVLRVMLFTIWILAGNVVGIVGVLQSGADNRFILKMDLFCQWAVGIPLCWLGAFYFHWPLHWVFFAAFSEEMVKLLFWIPRVQSKVWIRNLVAPANG